jgi:hypothetical protein
MYTNFSRIQPEHACIVQYLVTSIDHYRVVHYILLDRNDLGKIDPESLADETG